MSADKAPSLKLKIAIAVAALALLVILVQAIGLLFVLEAQEEHFIDQILERQIEHTMATHASGGVPAPPNTPHMHLYRLPPDARLPAPPPAMAKLPPGNHEVVTQEVEYHVAVRDANGERFFLTYDVDEHERRVEATAFLVIVGALLSGAVILASVHALAGRLTRGLATLAKQVTEGHEGSHATPGMEREVLTVAQALDAYDQRQAQLLAREREVTANLSHELRTPLTGIRTDAELLLNARDVPESARRRAQRIMDAVDRLVEVSRSLLLLAREARPQLVEEVNLRDALERAWEPLAPAAAAKGLHLDLQMGDDAAVCADASLLEIALRNLLDNAVRHSSAGAITCRFASPVLSVQDCGSGIAPEEMERLFERFHRGAAGNLGLGLTLVKHVCEACDWRVNADNAPDGGARFTLDFAGAAASTPPVGSSQIPHTSLTNS